MSSYQWLSIYKNCHAIVEGSAIRVGFPNGKCYDKQPAIIVSMFDIIEDECRKELVEQIKRGKRN